VVFYAFARQGCLACIGKMRGKVSVKPIYKTITLKNCPPSYLFLQIIFVSSGIYAYVCGEYYTSCGYYFLFRQGKYSCAHSVHVTERKLWIVVLQAIENKRPVS
jgi:predicted nucleic acid-binding Zn finger protein